MNIRRAHEKDIPRLIELLEQVLQIHADIRPDIFIPGTTKYTNEELAKMIKDDTKPIYVAADDDDVCMGYAFCQIRQQPFSNNMVPFTSLFIDDLCVDVKTRGQHIGEQLFEYVKNEAISAESVSFTDCFSAICVTKSAVTVLGLFLLPLVLGIGHKPLSCYDSLNISQV